MEVRYTKHVSRRKTNPGRQDVSYNGTVKHLQRDERVLIVNQSDISQITGALNCSLLILENVGPERPIAVDKTKTLLSRLINLLPAEKAYELQDTFQGDVK